MCPRPQHVCSQWEAGRGRRTSHHSWWWWWSINYIYLSYHVLYFIICQCVSRCFTNFSTRKYCVRYELYKMCMSSQWEAERGGEQVTTAGDDDELDMLYLSTCWHPPCLGSPHWPLNRSPDSRCTVVTPVWVEGGHTATRACLMAALRFNY